VKVTVESVDTGDRRQIGRYTARHVMTTTTTEPSPGASTRASEAVQARPADESSSELLAGTDVMGAVRPAILTT